MIEVFELGAFIEASVFWTALLLIWKQHDENPAYAPMLLWIGHATLFWTVLFVMSATQRYAFPSVWASTWSSIIYLHAGIGIVGSFFVRRAVEKKGYDYKS